MRLAIQMVLSILCAVDGQLDQIVIASFKIGGIDRYRDAIIRVQKKLLEARKELANTHNEMKEQDVG